MINEQKFEMFYTKKGSERTKKRFWKKWKITKLQKHVLDKKGFQFVMSGLRHLRLDLSHCGQMIKVFIYPIVLCWAYNEF